MAKPSQLAAIEGVHVLVYGEPKTGKSTLVAELLLHGYHLWWLSLDNGHEVIYKLKLSAEELDANLDIFPIPDTREFPVALAAVKAVMTGGEVFLCDAHGQPSCSICKKNNASFSRICLNEFGPKDILVIDHSGQLSESVMAYLTRKVANIDEYKPSYTDYMNQGTILAGIFSNIQQSRANIIVITHTVEAELEDGTKRVVPQTGTANFSRNVAKYFGHVVYLRVTNKAHKIGSSTTFDSNALTGSRTDIAVESMSAATLEPFFNGVKKAVVRTEQGAAASAKILALKQPVVSEIKPPPETAPEAVREEVVKEVEAHIAAKTSASTATETPASPAKISIAEKLALLNKGKK